MANFNIDRAVEYLKDIVNNNKCVTCDRLSAIYLRYPCGHVNCQNCVKTAEECLLCPTPPSVNNSVDKPLSRRTEHISNLLNTFQDLFNLNVFRRQRISDQLKAEKQVFPECIQAPSKYCNKRKSTLDNLVKDKENIISVYPGENISSFKAIEMENKNIYVKKWLDTNLPFENKQRKAFTDLGVNRNFTKDSLLGSAKHNIHNSYNFKRKNYKTLHNGSENLKDLPIKKKKLKKQANPQSKLQIVPKNNKIENDKSAIVIDEDIIIDDYIDKEIVPYQAVTEAEKHIHITKDTDINKITKTKPQSMLPPHKVRFYKSSFLYETCSLCIESINYKKTRHLNPVTIVIDNKNFVTTLNITDCKEDNYQYKNKQSVAIQTNDKYTKIQNLSTFSNIKSDHEHFQNYADNIKFKKSVTIPNSQIVNSGILVSESEGDSGTDDEIVNTLETTADVHTTSFHGFEVLAPLEPFRQEVRKTRKGSRGPSPLSNDSSDKENYDPNRAKRQKFNKKIKK